ncbi:MAG: hypothetical protein EXQ96_04375 [Alphaproteobacteria bacterium]|nr:hypothetical protein [Alphaproteobacteria bacterium]
MKETTVIDRTTARSAPAAAAGGGRSYGIIGAGASGLCLAKYLKEAGFGNVTLFEVGTMIGGMWCYKNDSGLSSAYRTLHINTARNMTNFHDYPFSEDVQEFPSHWDMHKYLDSYADHYDLRRHIQFKSRVKEVRPLFKPGADEPKWEVETEDGRKFQFDRVIVATGHLSKPTHVPMFQNDFKGEYVHSFYYKDPEPFAGKRICLVGVGNSGCDIGADLAMIAKRLVMVARSPVVIAPKLILGYPFTDVTMKLYRNWIPAAVRSLIIRAMVYLIHGSMQRLGFKKLDRRAHPTTNATIVQHIAYRRAFVKPGITRIEGQRLFFEDGSSEEFDSLIAANGFQIYLPFLPETVLPVKDNVVDLYKRICVPDWPGLYFMGMFNTTTALNQVFEHQSSWLVAVEKGELRLPGPSEMWADIRAKQAFIARHYKISARHTIEEEHLPYLSELNAMMPGGPIRKFKYWWDSGKIRSPEKKRHERV